MKSRLVAFLISLFLGYFGMDWFYLSDGNVLYMVAGLVKFLTGGGFGIWWLVDIIRILTGAWSHDGGGNEINNDM